MASLVVVDHAYIDYSILTGKVREFELMGITLYDEDKEIEVGDWEYDLWKFIKASGLHIDQGNGIPSFVYSLIDKYENKEKE